MDGDRWPTPRVSSANGAGIHGDGGLDLQTQVKLWPTPAARDHKDSGRNTNYKKLAEKHKLAGAVQMDPKTGTQLWPTPTAGNNYRNRKCPASELNGTHGLMLGSAVQLWPTPSANEDAAGTPAGNMQGMLGNHPGVRGKTPEAWAEGALNPAWVCWLMQWPLGWDSLEPLPPGSLEDWKQKTIDGSWWLEEPDIPRIARDIPQRAKRLKALGNGMVPLCFAIAYEELSR